MTRRLGVLCAGQGQPTSDMGARIRQAGHRAAWIDPLCEVVELDRGRLTTALTDPECAQTVVQPSLAALGLAQWGSLRSHVPMPVIVAGYSLGELVAAAVGGSIDDTTMLRLASVRAACMVKATTEASSLIAVGGRRWETTDQVAQQHGCAVAIVNGPQEAVVGGTAAALEKCVAALGSRVHITTLPVGLASHTSALRDAGDEFRSALRTARIVDLEIPLVRSHDGAIVHTREDVIDMLAGNVSTIVRWDLTMKVISEHQPDGLLEVGAGAALSRLWSAHHQRPWVHAIDEFSTEAAAAAWVSSKLESSAH